MQKILLVLILVLNITLLQGQNVTNTIYIDPTYTGGGSNGTISNPYNSILDVAIQNQTEYLWKRGTTDLLVDADNILIVEGVHDIIFSAYGTGAKPIIKSASNIASRAILEFRRSHDLKFDNIHVTGTPWQEGVSQPAACIMVIIQSGVPSYNVEINNCIVEHASWGIRGYGSNGNTGENYVVDSCIIRNTEDDGLYFDWIKNPVFTWDTVYNVNLLWYHNPGAQGGPDGMAPGDCLQTSNGSGYFIVRNCYLDRSNSGNKFCFIHGAGTSSVADSGLIEHNTMISPLSTGDGGGTIFLSSRTRNVVIRYNKLLNTPGHKHGGIYCNGSQYGGADHKIYYNILDSLSYGIYTSNTYGGTLICDNNIFYDMDANIRGRTVYARNNIFVGNNNGDEYGYIAVGLHESNNCYTSGYTGTNSITADPQFVNPASDNFHLLSSSPLIDQGIYVNIPVDLDGNTVPSEGVDIGAYEYLSGASYYSLNVVNGNGDGSYTASSVVTITANTPGTGQLFDQWTGDTQYLDDPNASSTNITMPAANVTVTAIYTTIPTYNLIVNNGTGDGSYTSATVVAITADAPGSGQVFYQWTGDTQYLDNPNTPSTNVTMPSADVSVTATFTSEPTYDLLVINGSGDGSYTAAAVVAITADAPGSGQLFDQWTGDTQYIDDPNDASTNVTMPDANVTVTATYTTVPTYDLVVNNGTGDGSYTASEVVAIAANAPGSGQLFNQWTGDTQYLDDPNDASTNVTMPASDVTVAATYTTIPTYDLTVISGSGDGSYLEDEVVSISANTPPSGQEFDQWTGDVSHIDNVFAVNTSVTMPASNVIVTATYIDIQYYNLNVTSGSGTGSYPENTIVNITANAAPSGYAFYQWSGDVSTIDDINATNTQITIPTNNVSISATYTLTDTYFIDPENANDPLEDGTIIHPFDSWEDVNFTSNSTYLQKRGTTCTTNQYFFSTYRSNILIGAYGSGERPIILSSSSNGSRGIMEFAYSYNITIENLHISGTPYQAGVNQPAACVMFSNTNTHNIIIRNCELEHAGWGIRAFSGDNMLIAGCEVHNIEDDGMYIQDCTNSEISYNDVHDINLKWFHVGHLESQSPGDCIQLARNCDNFFVHHNTLDRSNSGNKFCFIHSSSIPTDNVTGIFERNTCISPLADGDGAASIFLGSQGHDIIIRYNTFEGNTGGIYAHSEDLQVYYNTFTGLSYGVWGMSESDTINVVNNMFYNMDPELKGMNMVVKNNIFDLITDEGALDLVVNLDESHNLFTKGTGGNNSIIGDPLMVDPANGDFHLLDNSPCIDYGLDLGFNIDLDSLDVPYGSCPELGSFEFYGVQTINQPPNIAGQNYSVAENSTNGTFVCHVVASDPDDGQNVSYSILGGNINNAFSINSQSGNITVNNTNALNFENDPVFSLEIQVVDDWAIPLSTSATIIISLIDVNENPNLGDESFTIAENSSANSFIGQMVASDPDNGQTLTYSIQSGNTNNAFQIGSANGNISVQNTSALNYETQSQFNLVVRVQDNGTGSLSDVASVGISITDINEAPILDNADFIIAENSAVNTFIGQLAASDPDNGQSLNYTILSGNMNNAFQINASNGNITVQNADALDFENWDTYSLFVRVDDNGTGPLFDVATITISITDVNENPELDDEIWTLNENSNVNTSVGLLNANDPDFGQTLTYSIITGNIDNAFQINGATGELSVQNELAINYEVWPSFNLLVRVMDDGEGSLYDVATVVVNLSDLNETPIVEDQIFSLAENTASGQQVEFILASDPDNGQSLSYNIVGGSSTDGFELDEFTGMLSVLNADEINFELNPVITLIVEVEDNGAGNLNDQATIIINLIDVNETPIIDDQEIVIEIPDTIWNNFDENIVLGELAAFDPDQGQQIDFTILEDNLGAFSIDPFTGRLSIANLSLIKENLEITYEIIVEVEDNYASPLSDDALITIVVSLGGLNTGGNNGLTGIEYLLSDKDLNIYPNPTKGKLTVEIEKMVNGQNGEVVITDINGSVILADQFIMNNDILGEYDMSSVTPGVYLIHIVAENSVLTKKFIVQ